METKYRSSNYKFTVNNDCEGLNKIRQLQKEAKIFNAEERLKEMKDPGYQPKIRRIAQYGRLGKNNPNAQKYRDANHTWRNAYQRILLEDAATIDVYVGTYVKSFWACDPKLFSYKDIRYVI